MNRPALSLIAAVARNGAIGRNNALLWHDAQDLQHFRRVTLGCPVVMGRKTWDSLPEPFRPLPGRTNIVLTHDRQWHADSARPVDSLNAAIAAAEPAAKVFVIGGAAVFALALPLAHELVLTEIDADLAGDIFFPAWDRCHFREIEREPHCSAARVKFSFVTYRRGD